MTDKNDCSTAAERRLSHSYITRRTKRPRSSITRSTCFDTVITAAGTEVRSELVSRTEVVRNG
jgi:hypothetical protein